MSPTRYSSLFRNRWLALLWSAGVCWTAVEFTGCMDVGPPDTASTAKDTTPDADLNHLQALVRELEK